MVQRKLSFLNMITHCHLLWTAYSLGHSSWWACQWLPRDCCQRQTNRAPASYTSIARPSGTDQQRTKLPEGKWKRAYHSRKCFQLVVNIEFKSGVAL